jgi:hypothetical protein
MSAGDEHSITTAAEAEEDGLMARAAGLASLADGDPERVAAYREAERDPELRQALAEGEQLMQLLALAKPPPPSAEALQRASMAVLAEMKAEEGAAPTQQDVERPSGLSQIVLPAATLVGPVAVLAMHSQHLNHDHFPAALVLLAIALGAGVLLASVGALKSLLLGATLAAAAAFVGLAARGGWGELSGGGGCLMMTAISGAAPLLASLGLALRGQLRGRGPLAFAAVGSIGALAGMAALHLACPGLAVSHLAVFHGGGILASALLGLMLGALPPIRRATQAR